MATKPAKAPQITVDPATGRLMLDGQLLDRYDPRLWGRVGRNVLDVNTASGGAYGPEAYDPRYYEPYTEYDGDSGEVTRYRLRPEYADRIGNRTQLGQSGIGGYGEANDASGLVWDDEFGILADRGNINAPDDSGPQGIMANYVIPAATLAAMGYGAGSMAGLWGGGGVDLGAFGGLAPEEAMGLTSADMVGGASGVGALPEIGGLELLSPEGIAAANPALAAAPNAGGGGLLQWAMANPAQAARLGISAASLLSGGAGGRGSGGGSFSIDPTSPLRGNPAGGSTGNTTSNPNAPLDTSAGSPYAPVNTGPEMVMTTQGPMPASSVTGYVGQNAGGEKMAITPEIQNLLNIGKERLNRYRDTFIPLEDMIVGEATRAGSEASQEEQAGLAKDSADRQARRAREAILARIGPASGDRQAAFLAPMEVGAAGNAALAANEARRAERDSGFSKRLAAAGIGDKAISQGLSSLSGGVQALLDQDRTAASRENTAASVGAQIAGIQSRERESAADRAQRAAEFGEGTRRWDLDFGEGSRRYNLGRGDRRYEFDTRLGFDRDRAVSDDEYRRATFNATGEQRSRDNRRSDYRDIGSLLSGVGRFADSDAGQSLWDAVSGWFARGGKVRVKGYAGGGVVEDEELDLEGLQALADDGGQVAGPGTHTSDSIPAMLSDGEYVLPTEAVNIIDQLDPGLLDRIRALGLKVRDMGEQMEQGETFEGDFEEV